MIDTKQDVKELDRRLDTIDHDLLELTQHQFQASIQSALDEMKHEYLTKELQNMPITTLSVIGKKLNLNRLTECGYTSVLSLQHVHAYELARIPGIGDKSAYAIQKAVRQIKEATLSQFYPTFNLDRLSSSEFDLLRALYAYKTVPSEAKSLHKTFIDLHNRLEEWLVDARKKQNRFFAWFQREETKAKIETAIETLNEMLTSEPLTDYERRIRDLKHFTPSRDEVIQDFIAFNAEYYAKIEALDGPYDKPEESGLTGDIIDQVTRFELNTDHLHLSLRSYQAFGAKYALTFRRTILGDEMGLGKTIQAIAMINHLHQSKPVRALVISLLGILTNWGREIEKCCDIQSVLFHGKHRRTSLDTWVQNGGIMLTTYEHTKYLLQTDLPTLDVVIVDEAHYVKNPDAKRSIHTYALANQADYVLFMSGTPLENRLSEMQQLIHVLQPDIAQKITEDLRLLQPSLFRETISPVYLRRNRNAVLKELPELNTIPLWLDFGEEEFQTYIKALKHDAIHDMRRASWSGSSPKASPKLEALLEICKEAKENGHKILVFSFYKSTIQRIYDHLSDRAYGPITGGISNQDRQTMIDDYTNNEAGSVLISQIEAGGVGLNIQAASIVIICEPQWKPSTEEQAISRAYRMGQAKNVTVYRLLTANSLDAKMFELLDHKSEIFNLYARDSKVGDESLSLEEPAVIKEMLEEEKERLGLIS